MFTHLFFNNTIEEQARLCHRKMTCVNLNCVILKRSTAICNKNK